MIHYVSPTGGPIPSDHMMHDIVINISGHLYSDLDGDREDSIYFFLLYVILNNMHNVSQIIIIMISQGCCIIKSSCVPFYMKISW